MMQDINTETLVTSGRSEARQVVPQLPRATRPRARRRCSTLPARKCSVKASYRIPVHRHIRCGTRVGSRMADEKGACGVNVTTHRTREARAGTILAVLCPHKQGRAKANANDSRIIVEHVYVLCDRDVKVQPGRGCHKRAAHLARGTVTPDNHVEANMAGAEAAERETNERAAR